MALFYWMFFLTNHIFSTYCMYGVRIKLEIKTQRDNWKVPKKLDAMKNWRFWLCCTPTINKFLRKRISYIVILYSRIIGVKCLHLSMLMFCGTLPRNKTRMWIANALHPLNWLAFMSKVLNYILDERVTRDEKLRFYSKLLVRWISFS